jgi:hypothetical protein
MNKKRMIAAAVSAALGSIVAGSASAVTLTFDELATQPVQGLTTNGIGFGFTVGTQTSQDAVYNRPGPASTSVLSGAVLEGDARGILTLTFPTPTPVLSFGVALTAPAGLTPGLTVQLLGPAGQALGTSSVNTVARGTLSEARFDFSDGLLGRAIIDFNDGLLASPQRFAIDNLTVVPSGAAAGGGGGSGAAAAVPTPSGLALIGIGLFALVITVGRNVRRT